MGLDYEEIEKYEPKKPSDRELQELEAEQSLFQQQNQIPKILKWYAEEEFEDEFKNSDLYKNFWATFNKNLKLAFVKDSEMWEFEVDFLQNRLSYEMAIPSYKFKMNDMTDLENLRMHWRATMTRARGTSMGIVNERTMQATTINHMFRSDEVKENQIKPTKNNFFSKLSNLF